MKTTIQKWGDSLAVRIPRRFAQEIQLQENSTVDLTIKSGELVIVPSDPVITLESLIEQITDENRHNEIGTGPRVGSELYPHSSTSSSSPRSRRDDGRSRRAPRA